MVFELNRLTEFNKALVYGHKTESSTERQNGSFRLKDCLFPEMVQYEDLFLGYMYAQQNILPFIRANGIEQIDTEVFLRWIRTLHKFMANQLYKSQGDGPSGAYTTEEVFRWIPDNKIQNFIIQYLRGGQLDANGLVEVLEKEFDIKKEDTLAFIRVLDRVNDLPNSILWSWQLNNIDPNHVNNLFIWMKKLFAAYHKDKLSQEEKLAVDKIVIISAPPEQLEHLMLDYAQKTIRFWKICNPNDLDSLCKFLSETFYGLTKMHPFINGNGYIATCLINTILRSFNLPSILIREPAENDARFSNYSKAMACIASTREVFAAHIKERVITAMKNPFSDPELEKLLILRFDWLDLLKQIVRKNPTLDIDEVLRSHERAILSRKNYTQAEDVTTQAQINRVSAILEEFQKQKALLETSKPIVSVSKDSFFNVNNVMKIAAIGAALAAGIYCIANR